MTQKLKNKIYFSSHIFFSPVTEKYRNTLEIIDEVAFLKF